MSTLRKGNLKLAMASLGASKGRSLLTMLGIIIGVMSVIVVVGITQGVKEQIQTQDARYGKNVIAIRPAGSGVNLLVGGSVPNGANTMLTNKDVELTAKAPGVKSVTMMSAISGSAEGDMTVESPLVIATNDAMPTIIAQPIQQGGFFDENTSLPTVVLGPHIAQRLFIDNVPLGQTLTFRGQQFVVAGIFKEFAAPPFSLEANFNDAMFIPYKTAESLLGTAPGIYQILAKTVPDANVQATSEQILHKLTAAHGGAHDVSVNGNGLDAGASSDTLELLTLMTVGVALIAFVVGGVGIMNVMLVSVTERIHEIGLRKAIGATHRQILSQFVMEAFVLSFVGAAVGVLCALAGIGLLRAYTTLDPIIVWQVLVLAPLAAIIVGIIFGTAPAVQAARKDPIEALRHE